MGGVGETDTEGQVMSVVGSSQRSQSDSTALGFCSSSGAQVHRQWWRGPLHTCCSGESPS